MVDRIHQEEEEEIWGKVGLIDNAASMLMDHGLIEN